MNDFLKMDIFFVITTGVVLLVGSLSLIALYYVVRILRSVDHLAQNVSEESDDLRTDIRDLRTRVREEGMKMQHLVDFLTGFKARRSTRRKVKTEE